MPCRTARRKSGSWATSALNSSSESWRACSCGENVSGHVAHRLLQRLATSRYASTGDGSGVLAAARPMISSRVEAPVGPGRRGGLLTTDRRPLAAHYWAPAEIDDRAAQQR